MTFISKDAKLRGVDGFPEYEIGDCFDNQDEERVISINNEDTFLAGAAEEEYADIVYLAEVEMLNDAYDLIENLVDDNDYLFVFDYKEGSHFIAEQL